MPAEEPGNGPENAVEPRYRVGRHLGRTLYRDGELIGLMDSTVDAQMVADMLNDRAQGRVVPMVMYDKLKELRDEARAEARDLQGRIDKVREMARAASKPCAYDQTGVCTHEENALDPAAVLAALDEERDPVLSTQPGPDISVDAAFECETQPEGRPSIDT